MHVPKASDLLADELRERILGGDYAVGMALPTARVLAAQTQLSRMTVHEALRILEIQGLIEIRVGRTGGSFVKEPGQDAVAESVRLLVRGRSIDTTRLLEARAVLEPACAELAARHRSVEELDTLQRANVALAVSGTTAEFLAANVDWHVAVALASGNEILGGLMQAVARSTFVPANYRIRVDESERRLTEQAHRGITAAIRDGDPDLARQRMARQIEVNAEALGDAS